MKSWDVYMDSFVNIKLPDDVDPGTPLGATMLYEKALAKFAELLSSGQDVTLNWDRYPPDDTTEEEDA